MMKRLLIPLLVLAGCGGTELRSEPEPTAAEEFTPDPITDEEIQLIALEAAWDADELCPAYLDALDAGVGRNALDELALREIENGYGERLSRAAKARVLELLHDC